MSTVIYGGRPILA